MNITASYSKIGRNHIVKVCFSEKERSFRLYSGRAGKALSLMINSHPRGITTADMRRVYGIDDNKLFGELLDQSGFREYIYSPGSRGKLKIWDIKLENLLAQTSDLEEPVWFGLSYQGGLRRHLPHLVVKQGLICNILKLELFEKPQGRFLGNLRKPAIDHRVPEMKRGSSSIDNLQILSYYVNERKNQICAKCVELNCDGCALAYPETSDVIKSTMENISTLLRR